EVLDAELLPSWAQAVLRDAPTVSGQQRITRLADVLTERTGDGYARETARLLVSQPDAGARQVLAEGFIGYAEGLRLFEMGRYEASAQSLSNARERLQKAKSPQAGWAQVYLAIDRYQMRDLKAAEVAATGALGFATERGFVALAGRCRWIL